MTCKFIESYSTTLRGFACVMPECEYGSVVPVGVMQKAAEGNFLHQGKQLSPMNGPGAGHVIYQCTAAENGLDHENCPIYKFVVEQAA